VQPARTELYTTGARRTPAAIARRSTATGSARLREVNGILLAAESVAE
jgi:hypothetical protein